MTRNGDLIQLMYIEYKMFRRFGTRQTFMLLGEQDRLNKFEFILVFPRDWFTLHTQPNTLTLVLS